MFVFSVAAIAIVGHWFAVVATGSAGPVKSARFLPITGRVPVKRNVKPATCLRFANLRSDWLLQLTEVRSLTAKRGLLAGLEQVPLSLTTRAG